MATVSQIASPPQGWALCWPTEQASNAKTVSQIAAPQRWRSLFRIRGGAPLRCSLSRLRKWRQLHKSQPPPSPSDGEVERESATGHRYAALPPFSKVAIFSQIAAPQGWRRLICIRGGAQICWLLLAGFESGDSFTDRSPPPGMARFNLNPRGARYAAPLSRIRKWRRFH